MSLPLMRKTFIEAPAVLTWGFGGGPSLPLMRKTFIEASMVVSVTRVGTVVSSAYAEDFH